MVCNNAAQITSELVGKRQSIIDLTGWTMGTSDSIYESRLRAVQKWKTSYISQYPERSLDGRNADAALMARQFVLTSCLPRVKSVWNESWCLPNGTDKERDDILLDFYTRWFMRIKLPDSVKKGISSGLNSPDKTQDSSASQQQSSSISGMANNDYDDNNNEVLESVGEYPVKQEGRDDSVELLGSNPIDKLGTRVKSLSVDRGLDQDVHTPRMPPRQPIPPGSYTFNASPQTPTSGLSGQLPSMNTFSGDTMIPQNPGQYHFQHSYSQPVYPPWTGHSQTPIYSTYPPYSPQQPLQSTIHSSSLQSQQGTLSIQQEMTFEVDFSAWGFDSPQYIEISETCEPSGTTEIKNLNPRALQTEIAKLLQEHKDCMPLIAELNWQEWKIEHEVPANSSLSGAGGKKVVLDLTSKSHLQQAVRKFLVRGGAAELQIKLVRRQARQSGETGDTPLTTTTTTRQPSIRQPSIRQPRKRSRDNELGADSPEKSVHSEAPAEDDPSPTKKQKSLFSPLTSTLTHSGRSVRSQMGHQTISQHEDTVMEDIPPQYSSQVGISDCIVSGNEDTSTTQVSHIVKEVVQPAPQIARTSSKSKLSSRVPSLKKPRGIDREHQYSLERSDDEESLISDWSGLSDDGDNGHSSLFKCQDEGFKDSYDSSDCDEDEDDQSSIAGDASSADEDFRETAQNLDEIVVRETPGCSTPPPKPAAFSTPSPRHGHDTRYQSKMAEQNVSPNKHLTVPSQNVHSPSPHHDSEDMWINNGSFRETSFGPQPAEENSLVQLTELQEWLSKNHEDRVRTSQEYSQADKDFKLFMMPACWQSTPDIVAEAVEIGDWDDPDSWKDNCGFHDGTGVLNIFSIDTMQLVNLNEDSTTKNEEAWIQTQVLDHWKFDNFMNVARYLKLTDSKEPLFFHPRWAINFPTIPGRLPYFYQVFGAVMMLASAYRHHLVISADKTGVGKSCSSVIWSRLLLHSTENLIDIQHNPEKHCPSDARAGSRCPQRDNIALQCLCEPDNFLRPFARIVSGYTLEVTNLPQFRDPWIDEIFAVHQVSDWNPRPNRPGSRPWATKPMRYWAVHNMILGRGTLAEKTFFHHNNASAAYQLIAGTFEKQDEDGEPISKVRINDKGMLNLANSKVPDYDGLAVEEREARNQWYYDYPPQARYITLGVTPVGWRDLGKNMGARYQKKELRKVPRVKEHQLVVRSYMDASTTALPGVIKVDEAHQHMGDASIFKQILETINTKFSGYKGTEVPIVMLQSGTWSPNNPAKTISLVTTQLEVLFENFDVEKSYVDHCEANIDLCAKNIIPLADDAKQLLENARKSFRKQLAQDSFASYSLKETEREKCKSLNKSITVISTNTVIQRSMSTKMFGKPIGLEAHTGPWFITCDDETLGKINAPILGQEEATKMKANFKKAMEKSNRTASRSELLNTIISSHVVGSRRARISSMLPEFKQVAENDQIGSLVRASFEANDGARFKAGEGKEKKWSELSEEDQDEFSVLRMLNGEMKNTGWNKDSIWPAPPVEGCRQMYKIALGLLSDEADRAAISDPTKVTRKYQAVGIWVQEVLRGHNKVGQRTAGMALSQNTWVLNLLRSWLWDVLSDRSSPWYVSDMAKYEVLVIDTDCWGMNDNRSVAAKFANHKNWEVFHEARQSLATSTAKKEAKKKEEKQGKAKDKTKPIGKVQQKDKPKIVGDYQTGHPPELFDPDPKKRFYPHILLGGTILSTGISMQRHTKMLLLEPFTTAHEIKQGCGRTNRINSTEVSEVKILVMKGAIYDMLCWGNFTGPEFVSESLERVREVLKKHSASGGVKDDGDEDEDDDNDEDDEDMDVDDESNQDSERKEDKKDWPPNPSSARPSGKRNPRKVPGWSYDYNDDEEVTV